MIRTYRQYLQASSAVTSMPCSPPPGGQHDRGAGPRADRPDLGADPGPARARQMPEARLMLRLLASFADAPVPYQLLLHPASLAACPLFAGITGPRLWQVQGPGQFGLIDLAASDDDPTPSR